MHKAPETIFYGFLSRADRFRHIKNIDFYCPCHNSNFKLNGDILSGVSPRAMDPLEIEVRNTSEVWVKFQNFQPGHDHPVPVS